MRIPLRRRRANSCAKSRPRIELHGDEVQAVLLAILVDGDDIVVFKLSNGTRFALEAQRQGFVFSGCIGGKFKDFDGCLPSEAAINAFVDARHSACCQHADQGVIP